ncbi:MAG: PAS domain-containing protein [bacterium]|nr:PAS domain-containing protein [bacterium]
MDERGAEALHARVLRVMAARLGVCVGALALALTLVGAGRLTTEVAEQGLYGTLGVAFLATALYAALLPFVQDLRRFAAVQLLMDLALVTALVVFSGGAESIFSFLYLPVVVFGALLFDRTGGYGAASGASIGFGSAILGSMSLPFIANATTPTEFAFTLWGAHSGAMLLVALFGSGLARELRIADERLEASAWDLAELRSLHERIVESLTSGVLTTDKDGCVTSFNPEAGRITGKSVEEVSGARLEAVLPGIEEVLSEASHPKRRRARFRLECSGGEERFLGVAISDLRNAEASASGCVVIFQDVTEVVRLEGELERNARLAGIGQLSASIAHEIRNPLAAISGSVEMLRATLSAAEEGADTGRLMGIVLREIGRLNQLITDFLQYARPAPPKMEPLVLGALAGEVAEAFETVLEAEVQFDVDVASGAMVEGDASQLKQLLWNLLGNAHHALNGQGRMGLQVNTEQVDDRSQPQEGITAGRNTSEEASHVVELVVSDSGMGIAHDVLERIFDPFFTTRSEGTGLGLAVVHRIVENHRGVVQVESREGSGTRIHVRLPMRAPVQ